MKYIALLRGINVGGNNIIKMADLKLAFEQSGFTNVTTYIQSGNVIFESNKKSIGEITKTIESTLSKEFTYTARVVIRSLPQVQEIVKNVPSAWKKENNLRCYVAFIKDHLLAENVAKKLPVNQKVDFIDIGKGVLYMSTKRDGLTSSGFTKIIGKKIFQEITIRNYNTTQKILALMES